MTANIIKRAKSGDESAFAEIFSTYHNRVYYFARSHVRSTQDAEDIVQNTFAEVFRSIGGLTNDGAFKSWLYTIAQRQIGMLYRKNERSVNEQDMEEAADMPEDYGEFLPGIILESDETKNAVMDVIQFLPYAQKTAVLFYYFEEMGVKDIAEIQGCSVGTVKGRLSYARKHIKSEIEKRRSLGNYALSVAPVPIMTSLLREMAAKNCLPQGTAEMIFSQSCAAAGVELTSSAAVLLAAEAGGGVAASGAAGGAVAAGTASTAAAATGAAFSLKAVICGIAACLVISCAGAAAALNLFGEPADYHAPAVLSAFLYEETAPEVFESVAPKTIADAPVFDETPDTPDAPVFDEAPETQETPDEPAPLEYEPPRYASRIVLPAEDATENIPAETARSEIRTLRRAGTNAPGSAGNSGNIVLAANEQANQENLRINEAPPAEVPETEPDVEAELEAEASELEASELEASEADDSEPDASESDTSEAIADYAPENNAPPQTSPARASGGSSGGGGRAAQPQPSPTPEATPAPEPSPAPEATPTPEPSPEIMSTPEPTPGYPAEQPHFTLTVSAEETTITQGEDFALTFELKNISGQDIYILYTGLFTPEVSNFPLPRQRAFAYGSTITEVNSLSGLEPGTHELQFDTRFQNMSSPLTVVTQVRSNTLTLTVLPEEPPPLPNVVPVFFEAIGGSVSATVDGVEIASGDEVQTGREVWFTMPAGYGRPEISITGSTIRSLMSITWIAAYAATVGDEAMHVTFEFRAPPIDPGLGLSLRLAGDATVYYGEDFLVDVVLTNATTQPMTIGFRTLFAPRIPGLERVLEVPPPYYTIRGLGVIQNSFAVSWYYGALPPGTHDLTVTAVFYVACSNGFPTYPFLTSLPDTARRVELVSNTLTLTVLPAEPLYHTVTFFPGRFGTFGGTLVASESRRIAHNTPLGEFPYVVNENPGYTLAGWYECMGFCYRYPRLDWNPTAPRWHADTPVTRDVRLVARWNPPSLPNVVPVFFEASGGTGGSDGRVTATVDGAPITSGTEVQTGREVVFTISAQHGWRGMSITGGFFSVLPGSTNAFVVTVGREPIHATFDFGVFHAVTFSPGYRGSFGATHLATYYRSVAHNAPLGEPPFVVRPGHNLAGWYEEATGTRWHADTPVTRDVHLVARWNPPSLPPEPPSGPPEFTARNFGLQNCCYNTTDLSGEFAVVTSFGELRDFIGRLICSDIVKLVQPPVISELLGRYTDEFFRENYLVATVWSHCATAPHVIGAISYSGEITVHRLTFCRNHFGPTVVVPVLLVAELPVGFRPVGFRLNPTVENARCEDWNCRASTCAECNPDFEFRSHYVRTFQSSFSEGTFMFDSFDTLHIFFYHNFPYTVPHPTLNYLAANIENLRDGFFDTHYLLIYAFAEGSGCIRHSVQNVRTTPVRGGMSEVEINRYVPPGLRTDMAYWYIIIELCRNLMVEGFEVTKNTIYLPDEEIPAGAAVMSVEKYDFCEDAELPPEDLPEPEPKPASEPISEPDYPEADALYEIPPDCCIYSE